MILVVGSGAFALTDEQGMFEIDNIPASSYEVLAQREHLTAGRQMVTVDPGEAATVDFVLGLSPVHEDVTVTASVGGTETTFEAFNAVTTLDSFDITRESAGSLGDALRNEPGIASRSFGPGSSRPIIRGFDGDRVLILEDGLRTGDLSSQSGDHGVTIDPNGAERIEIVRGPATLLYGSNAVGGLVNVITPHESYRESLFDGTRAQFGTNVGSANAEAGTTASLQYSQNNVLVWGGGSMRRTDDYDTPQGAVENSATELTNARAGLGWFGDRFFASSGFTLEDGRYGVPFADEFHQAHGVHAGEGPAETEIDIASRRRVGRFDMGLRNLANTVIEGVRVALNVIDWKHDELEVEDGIENIGTRFTNRTYIMRADVDQRQTDRLSGRFGAWAQLRDFEAVGVEALAPRTDQTSFAAFAYEEVDFRRTRLQFGGRVEQNDYRTAGRMVPDAPADDHGHSHGLEVPDARDRQFLGASASVGLHTDVGAGSAFVANLTHSHRAPALEELYNFGPHVGNLAFEVGNPTLDAETTLGLDVSFRHQTDRVRSNLNAYVYSIDNFIFGDRTGEVEDNLPVWYFVQGDSRFVGFDAKSSVRLGWERLGHARHRLRRCDPDHDRRAAAAHPAVARDREPRRPVRRIHVQSATGVRGAAGQRVPGRDGDERLLHRQPAGVLRLAAAAHGAHPVVHGLQPDERAVSQPHLVHQGSGPRDGTRGQGELLGAVLLGDLRRRTQRSEFGGARLLERWGMGPNAEPARRFGGARRPAERNEVTRLPGTGRLRPVHAHGRSPDSLPRRAAGAVSSVDARPALRNRAPPCTGPCSPCSSSCPGRRAWSTRCSGSRSWACSSAAPPTPRPPRSPSSSSAWRSAAPSSAACRRACGRRCGPTPGWSWGSRRRPWPISFCWRSTSASTGPSTTPSSTAPRRSTRPGSPWRSWPCYRPRP